MSRRGPIIAGVVSGVLALLLIVFLVLPKMGQVGDVQDELTAAEDQEIALQAEVRALQDAQAAAPETEEQIQALDDQVPTTTDLPGLFRLLQSAADRAAVDFFQFSPGSPTPDASGAFSVIPSQIVVTGGYFSVQEFLYNLESLPRANKVMSVALSPGSQATEGETATISTSGRLSLQATVEFYTTDSSAGPGSLPGPTTGLPTEPAATAPVEATEQGV